MTVNVGMGATDPQDRMQKFVFANQTWQQMIPALPADANPEEIKKELFGLIGYRDSMRFYSGRDDPRIAPMKQQMQQLQQMIQQLELQLQNKTGEIQAKRDIATQTNQTKLMVSQQGGEDPQLRLIEMKHEDDRANRRLDHEMAVDHGRLALEAASTGERLAMERQRTRADIENKDFQTMHKVKQGYIQASQKSVQDKQDRAA